MRFRYVLVVALLMMTQGAFAQGAPFRDVPTSNMRAWASKYVEHLVEEGIFEGYPDGRWHGERAATRYEAAMVLGRLWYRLQEFERVHSDVTVEFLLEQFAPIIVQTGGKSDERKLIFRDIPPSVYCWGSGEYIRRLTEQGIWTGYPGELFYGREPMTRYELAVLVSRFIRRTERKQPLNFRNAFFKDVTGGEWAFGAVLVAVGTGVMEGYPDRTFRGSQPVTRSELAVALARLMQIQGYGF